MRIVVSGALVVALTVGLCSVSLAQSRYYRDRSGGTSYQSDSQYSSDETAGDNDTYSDQSGDTANYDGDDSGSTYQDQSGDSASYSSDSDNNYQSDDSTSNSGDDGSSSYQDQSSDAGEQSQDCYVNRRGRTVCR